jgi:hypothetical protein
VKPDAGTGTGAPGAGLRQSLFAFLGGASKRASTAKVDAIRASMLRELEPHNATTHARVLWHVRSAVDIEALWYLRGEIMEALSAEHGEVAARETLVRISRLFKGQLPGSLKSRASRLDL